MKILAVDDEKIALEALEDALRKALTDSEIFAFRTSAGSSGMCRQNKL